MDAASRPVPRPSRRALLAAGLGAAALPLVPEALAGSLPRAFSAPRPPAVPDRRTSHVVLIAFAGGVRSKETFGAPAAVPNLAAMAEQGVLYRRARTANLGHYGATLSLFTGISEARGIRDNARGPDPTLFEYVRKHLGLPGGDVWITTSGGAQQVNYAYGLHTDYGARFGATTLDGDGIFNREFRSVLKRWGVPKPMEPSEQARLERLRSILAGGGDAAQQADSLQRVESYILRELTGGTAELTGANAADAKALRLAKSLLVVFRPRLVAVVLQDADVAHRSYNAYTEVIRRNDAAIGDLWRTVAEDPELSESTAFVVVPEFGRDRDLNSRRGLDHGDGSDDLNFVSCLAWGPDFRRGALVDDEVRVIDVVPTLCELLGADAPHARGRRLPRLFA